MATQKDRSPQISQTSYYLVFDELAECAPVQPDAIREEEEIDEIEQIRRMVLEVEDEKPSFMTST